MPASLTPQSLPPFSPTMSMYLSDSTVVMCMRAGLYQTKNGLPVFFGSLRSRKSMTWEEISSSTVFDRSRVSGPSSLQFWLASVPSEDLHNSTGRGGVRHVVVLGSTAPGTSAKPGIGVLLQGGATACSVGDLVDVGEAHPLHGVEVIEIAPKFLEPVCRRQRHRCGRRDGSCRIRRWCSRDRAGTWRASAFRSADRTGCREFPAGPCRRAAAACR